MRKIVFLFVLFLCSNYASSQLNYTYPRLNQFNFWNHQSDLEIQPLEYYKNNNVKSVTIYEIHNEDSVQIGFIKFSNLGLVDSASYKLKSKKSRVRKHKKTDEIYYIKLGYDSLNRQNKRIYKSTSGTYLWSKWKSTRYIIEENWRYDENYEIINYSLTEKPVYRNKLHDRFHYPIEYKKSYFFSNDSSLKKKQFINHETIYTDSSIRSVRHELVESYIFSVIDNYSPRNYYHDSLMYNSKNQLVYWRPMSAYPNGTLKPQNNYYKYDYNDFDKIVTVSLYFDLYKAPKLETFYTYNNDIITEKQYYRKLKFVRMKPIFSKKDVDKLNKMYRAKLNYTIQYQINKNGLWTSIKNSMKKNELIYRYEYWEN